MGDSPVSADGDVLPAATLAHIMGRLGVSAYRWTAIDDRLVWSGVVDEAPGADAGLQPGRGRDYDARIVHGSGASRAAAARASATEGPEPRTRLFETVYRLRAAEGRAAPLLWIEDRGVGHFDAQGGLTRIDGLVRVHLDGRERPAPFAGQDAPFGYRSFAQLIEQGMAGPAAGTEAAFLLVGLDRLGRLNEVYGPQIGDELIEAVYGRLRAGIAPGEVLARFSGSKFGVIVAGEGAARARHLIAAVNETPLRTSAGLVLATVSAGVVPMPGGAGPVADIEALARDALRSARTLGPGHIETYHAANDHSAARRANLRFVDDMLSALAEDRVHLALQPVAATGTREVAFHEALVRVRGRDGTVHDGATIMPVADRFGLTVLLDRRSLELAIAALAGDADLRLSVNVAPTSIDDETWLGILDEGTRRGYGGRLIVELTEAADILDMEAMRRRVAWLHERGVRVAMDDFGVGYTSFRSLRRLGVDMLKIDGSYICTLMESAEDRHFVRALLELAANLGMESVAEWVLDEPTARQLADWGCSYLQGELIGLARDSKMPPDDPARGENLGPGGAAPA